MIKNVHERIYTKNVDNFIQDSFSQYGISYHILRLENTELDNFHLRIESLAFAINNEIYSAINRYKNE